MLSFLTVFPKPEALSEISTPAQNPFISADGQELYFDAMGDLFTAHKGAATFGAPSALRLANSAALDTEPVVTPDGLTLYFTSYRTDGAPKGMGDIWVSKRATRADEFGPAKPVEELNSAWGDYAVWGSSDGCEIFLTDYNPDSKSFDVLTSRRPE